MGRGLLSGLFWGGAASMVLLIAASVYFPLRDLSTHATEDSLQGAEHASIERPETRPFLADPPPREDVSAPTGTDKEDAPGASGTPPEPDAVAQTLTLAEAERPPAPPPQIATELAPQTAPDVTTQDRAPQDARSVGDALPPSAELAVEPDISERPASPVRALPPVANAPETVPSDALAALNTPVPVPDTSVPATLVKPGVVAMADGGLVRPDENTGSDPSGSGPLLAMPVPDLSALNAPDATAPATPRALAALAPGGQPEVSVMSPETALLASPRPVTDLPQSRDSASSALSADQLRAPAPPRAAPPVATRPPASPNAGRAPESPPPPVTPPVAEPVEAPEVETAPVPENTRTAQAIPVQTQSPRVLLGGGSETLVSRGPGLSTRLPRIGELSPQQATATPDQGTTAPVGALTRNARNFEAPQNVGLVSILLELTQGDRATLDAVTQFRAPLAIVIDPTLPAAPEWAAALRAAGHEVLIALTGLPPAPTPRDIDVALSAHISMLPEAVGVWLPQDNPVFTDRILLRHMVAVLSDTGHGLVTPLSGLDAAGQEARAAGLPAASVARRVQGAQEVDLLRSLAQGALRAGSTGRYVLQAEPRAEVLSALATWNSGLGGQSLVLAPVSALLLATNL